MDKVKIKYPYSLFKGGIETAENQVEVMVHADLFDDRTLEVRAVHRKLSQGKYLPMTDEELEAYATSVAELDKELYDEVMAMLLEEGR